MIRASTEFRKIIDAPNFITQEAVTYAFINRNLVYEISKGELMEGEMLFGITVVDIEQRQIVRSRSFDTLEGARSYAAELKRTHTDSRHIHEDAPGDAVQSAAGHDTTGASE